MSQITLKPLDDGQSAVEIPLGKTTIGRGALLGCNDKKVSRNHAVLEVTSKGEVYLTPTHVNPCFYQPTADSPGQILKKDIPHKLENGDSFSLLPRAYRYQLSVVGDVREDKNTDQNDLKKQSGKTNGAAGDGSEEGSKDALKGVCNEELGDTIVVEKFTKEEDPLANTEKSHAKEENNFSKKLADMKEDKKPLPLKEGKEKDLSPPKENNVPSKGSPSDTDAPPRGDAKESAEEAPPAISESPTEHSKMNDVEESASSDSPSKVEKPAEESESTLHLDAFPKSNVPDVDDPSDDASEPSKEAAEDKSAENCEESQDDEMANPASKESDAEVDKSSRTEDTTSPGKRTRKKAAPKQPNAKKQTTKRKGASDSSPKPKARKKMTKFVFEPGEEGSSQRQVAGRTSSRTNRQTRQGLSLEDFIVSDDEEWQSDRSEPKVRQRKKRRDDDSGSDWEVEHKRSKKPAHKFGSGSESGSDWGSHKKKKGGPRGKRRKNKSTASDAGSEEETAASNTVKPDKPRIPCTYGKKCYRRNPNHVGQFCHPGDSDYASEPEVSQKNETVSESEPDESSSPKKECPYGANCFRKNPQHKKDFKHTKKVRPQREAAKQADKKTKSSRNSDEVDTYDLNDSFLNEDSADEYKPVDSGSDYESGEKSKNRLAKAKAGKSRRGRKA